MVSQNLMMVRVCALEHMYVKGNLLWVQLLFMHILLFIICHLSSRKKLEHWLVCFCFTGHIPTPITSLCIFFSNFRCMVQACAGCWVDVSTFYVGMCLVRVCIRLAFSTWPPVGREVCY